MVDLDLIWTETDELYCQFGVAFCLGKFSWVDWRLIVGRLVHYRYVFPDNRFLNETLLDEIYSRTRKTAAEMMRFVLLVGQLESHYTEQEQARMLSILVAEGDN